MKKLFCLQLSLMLGACVFSVHAAAFRDRNLYLGAGYYSQNVMNRTTRSIDSSPSFMGEANYPFLLKYDYWVGGEWFVAPQLEYTAISRSDPGSTASVSFVQLALPIGRNYSDSGTTAWDWSIGPSYINYTIKGAGGTTVMNNGTTTATFAIPGATSTISKLALVANTSYTFSQSRLGLDLIVESPISSSKRTQSLMLSYCYQFDLR